MINEHMFRIKKNGEPVKNNCYCRHLELIENYDLAIADETQIWECHHRFEALFTKQELIKYNWYYDVEPNCLIFLTPAEHNSLHKKGKPAHNRKKVLCIETGEIFESMGDAERKTGISNSHISQVCNGKLKTTGGYHWKYV